MELMYSFSYIFKIDFCIGYGSKVSMIISFLIHIFDYSCVKYISRVAIHVHELNICFLAFYFLFILFLSWLGHWD